MPNIANPKCNVAAAGRTAHNRFDRCAVLRHIAYPLSAVPTTAPRSSKAGRRTRTADPERGAVRVTVGFTSTHVCSSYRAPRRGEEDARLDPEGPPDSAADSESGGAEI